MVLGSWEWKKLLRAIGTESFEIEASVRVRLCGRLGTRGARLCSLAESAHLGRGDSYFAEHGEAFVASEG